MRKYKLLWLVLVIALLMTMASACGSTPAGSGSASGDASAPASAAPAGSAAAPATEPAPEPTPEPEPALDGNTPIQMPLSEEGTEFSLWMTDMSMSGLTDFNEGKFYPYMEKLTNVHVNFTIAAYSEAVVVFNLLVAGGEYPDAMSIYNDNTYFTSGLDEAIEQEVIIPLEDYSEYFPNYNYRRGTDEETLLQTVTSGGHIAAIHQLKSSPQGMYQGLIVRNDLLQKYGYEGSTEDVTTIAELEEILQLFASNDIAAPWWGGGAFWSGLDAFVMPAFGMYNDGQLYQVDGTVHFGPAENSFKDYLALYRDWFAAGYLSADFMTHVYMLGTHPGYFGELQNGGVGIGPFPGSSYDLLAAGTVDGGTWTAMPAPVMEKGDTIPAAMGLGVSRQLYQTQCLVISTACDEELVPIILQYFDYLFTDEGSKTASFGFEGDTYTLDESGNPVFADYMTNSAEGYSINVMFTRNCCYHNVPFLYDWTRESTAISADARHLTEVWEKALDDDLDEFLSLPVPVDQASSYSSMLSEVQTYATEYALKVITGAEDLDSTWDSYLEQLNALGAADVVRIQQEALDTFYMRDTTVGY